MSRYLTWGLRAVAGAVAAAGAVLLLPATLPITLPAAVVAVATKVVVFGTTAGIVAAKVLPGHGANAPGADPAAK